MSVLIEPSKYLNAQNAVLGSVLIDARVAGKVVLELEPKDFEPPLRTVFQAIEDLYVDGKPIDPISVCNRCGEEYVTLLRDLMEITPTAANIESYIEIVRKESRLKALRTLGLQIAEVGSLDEAKGLMEQANAAMVSTGNVPCYSMAELLLDFQSRLDKPPVFLEWPIEGLQGQLRTKPGHFVILAAEPSTGKTAMAIQCGLEWAKTKRVGFFSLETGEEDMEERIVSNFADLSYTAVQERTFTKSEEAMAKYDVAAEDLAKRNFFIIPCSTISIQDIESKALEKRFDIIIIDYIQLIETPGRSEYEELSHISKSAHRMAQRTGITVVALAQVSRAGAAAGDLSMHDIKGTGQFEQDANAVLMLGLLEPKNKSGLRYLKLDKNKGGKTAVAYLGFAGDKQRFYKVSAQEAKQWLYERKQLQKRNA